mgnify:CR=1 FL=1
MKKMSKKATALAGLGVLAVVGGTFAYYNQTVSLENPLTTGHYDNELIEDYTPPTDDLKPGATIDKVVGAKNTGDYPVMVRIKMDEVWRQKDADGNNQDIISHDSTEGDGFAAIAIGTEDVGYGNEFDADQADDTDGLVDGDESVVRKNLAEDFAEDWTYNANDGYWYYNKILNPDQTTGNLLESITLASDIDLGHYIQKDWYYVGPSSMTQDKVPTWNEYTVTRDETSGEVTDIIINGASVGDRNGDDIIDAIDMALALNITSKQKLFRKNESLLDEYAKGYADANYTLTVTSQFVQATPDALETEFGSELPDDIKRIIEGLKNEMGVPETTAATEG